MKTVIHLVKNSNMLEGGIKTVINNFVKSDILKTSFNMFISDPFEVNQKADIFIWHENFNYQNLTRLVSLKLKYKDSKFIVVQHHTTKGFYDYYEAESRLGIKTKICYLTNYLGYLLADKVVCVSHTQANWLASTMLIKNKIKVITPSEPLDKFLNIPYKPIGEKLILGCYGRAHPQKGFRELIEVVRDLPDVDLYIQLLQGPLLQELLELIEQIPNVYLYEDYDDVTKFIERCDVIVVPSVWEPFGLVALEAKASGKVILVADVDGLPEQAGDIYGYTFSRNVEYNSLTNVIKDLSYISNYRELFKSKGEQARQEVINNWNSYLILWSNFLNGL